MKPHCPLPDTVNDFLGSAYGLTTAIDEVVEKKLLCKVAGTQVSFAQLKLLKLVALTDARTIRDVATFLGVSDAAASKAVDKLVRRGLLRRVEGEADRRAVHLLLTKTCRRLLTAYDAVKRRKLTRVFAGLPEGELARTAQFLDRLSADVINHAAIPEEVCRLCGIYFRDQCLVRRLAGHRCFYDLHKPHRSARRAHLRRSSKRASAQEKSGENGPGYDSPAPPEGLPETSVRNL